MYVTTTLGVLSGRGGSRGDHQRRRVECSGCGGIRSSLVSRLSPAVKNTDLVVDDSESCYKSRM